MSSKFKKAVLIYLVVNLLYVLAIMFVVQDDSLTMADRAGIVSLWVFINVFVSGFLLTS